MGRGAQEDEVTETRNVTETGTSQPLRQDLINVIFTIQRKDKRNGTSYLHGSLLLIRNKKVTHVLGLFSYQEQFCDLLMQLCSLTLFHKHLTVTQSYKGETEFFITIFSSVKTNLQNSVQQTSTPPLNIYISLPCLVA